MKCIIMAGGKGTRLWPISRKDKPKQFQYLISDKTMLQETFLRLRKKFDAKDIFVSTNEKYVREVEKEILELPKKNILGEPAGRGSAASIALTVAHIAAKNPDEIIFLFPSDHFLKNPDLLNLAIGKVEKFLKTNNAHIVTIAVKPTNPETGLGYIENGTSIVKYGKGFEIFKVKKFVEKPDFTTAQKYLKSDNFLWNTAIYAFHAGAMIEKFKKHTPNTHNRLIKIMNAVNTKNYKKVLFKEYPKMDKTDFAYSIVENDNEVAAMPLALDWSDVGTWTSLKNSLSKNDKTPFIKREHIDFNSENVFIYGSKKLIVTIGVKDLIIINSDDAILICDHNKSGMVSDVIKHLNKKGKTAFL